MDLGVLAAGELIDVGKEVRQQDVFPKALQWRAQCSVATSS